MNKFTQLNHRYCLKEAAKELGISQGNFILALHRKGFLQQKRGELLPSNEMIKKGLMSIQHVPFFVGPVKHYYKKVLITNAGMNFLWGVAREAS